MHGSIPEEFDFCPPSFTPCSIYCEEARKVLQWWWAAVKKNDPISEGDTIKTGDKSVAVIQFENDAASVEIQENAEFSISKFTM